MNEHDTKNKVDPRAYLLHERTNWKQLKTCLFSSHEFLKLAPSRIYIEKIHRHNCRHHKWVTWHTWHYDKTQTKTQDCLVNLTNTLYCGHLCLAKFYCNARLVKNVLSEVTYWKIVMVFHNALWLLLTAGIPTWKSKSKNCEQCGYWMILDMQYCS